MPRNFTPADREEVVDETEERAWCNQAVRAGPGVFAIAVYDWSETYTFTGLTEDFGWYVDKTIESDKGDMFLLMPMQEVP